MQRLIVSLEAKTVAFEKAMNKALGVANRRTKAIESQFAKMNSRIGNSLAGVGKQWVAALAAGLSVGAIAKFSDAATRIDNALKVAGLSGAELEKVYGRLRDSAVSNAAPIEALVELYGRAALVQKELNITGEELLGFTDKIALALRVSGKSAAESSGALLQLSQALGSGTVRAEEFNSILEGALPIAQAAAAGLEEAGGSVAKLRQLVVDGKISSEAFFRAFEAGSVILEQKVQGATLTLSQAMGNLETALIDSVREFNNATGASEKFAEGINNVAQSISDFDITGFINKISEAGGALEKFLNSVGNADVFERLAELLTGEEITVGQPIDLDTAAAEAKVETLERDIKLLKEQIENNKEMAVDTTEASSRLADLMKQVMAIRNALAGVGSMSGQNYEPGTPGDPNALAQRQTLGTRVVKPVSINDFAPPSGGKGGSKGGGKKSRENEYQREIEQIRERTAALQAETAAMAGINPLVNDYGFAIEKARVAQELLAAAQAAGLAITPELKANIETLATAYATASAESEKLAEKQDKLRDMAEEFNGLAKDVLSGFIQDLKDGKSATEALEGALSKVADKLLDMALSSIFGGTGGIGGLLAGLFGYAEGGYTGSGGKNQAAGVVHKGEYVFSKKATQRLGVGNLEAMHRSAKGYASGGFVGPAAPRIAGPATTQAAMQTVISMPISISAPGADAAALARVERSVQELGRNVPKIVESTIHQKQTRKGRP